MPKSESTQKQLQKIRPPRVQMSYDVEIGGAIEVKELPFVMGVIGDFGGASEAGPKRLKERSFVGIERDNFDDVINAIEPRVTLRVADKLSGQPGQFAIELTFRAMADFRPEAVVLQVAPLRRLLEARNRLADLRNKLAGNDALEEILTEVLNNSEKVATLGQEQGQAQGQPQAQAHCPGKE